MLVAAERRSEDVSQLIEQIVSLTGDQKSLLSSVGLTELVHGIYRAKTQQARERRHAFIRELIEVIEVLPFTKETALLAGKLDGEQRIRGIVIPFADLLIGATALEFSYSILTANVRHFRLLPGLNVIQF